MDLELHQLERRYEALRTRNAARERRLLGSIAEIGQQTPIVVVRDVARFVVIDGYKRLRALVRLGQDTVAAVEWALAEVEALLFERILRAGDADSPIEQGWFLRELVARFGLGLDVLARRLDRSKSWVSRRIALVSELPATVQEHVRAKMPQWKVTHPGAENLTLAVMGCIVNGPGESRHANIGISLPGTGEAPSAPVFEDGEKTVTLRGDNIANEFVALIDGYVERNYGGRQDA